MNIYEITTNIVKKNYNIFDYNIFNIYFSNIINNNLKEANKILFNLYDDGYDVSDIYFFLYDFIKQENKEEYYIFISLICYYINENYNGNYNKIFLIFLTYDINQIIKNKVDIIYDFIKEHLNYENHYYVYNIFIFKKLIYNNILNPFLKSLETYYYKSKYFYLDPRVITFNRFNTILRQIFKKNNMSYTKKIKYINSKYTIEYIVLL